MLLLVCNVDAVTAVVVDVVTVAGVACVNPVTVDDGVVAVFDCVGIVVDVEIVDAFTAADAAATAAAAADALLLLLLFICVRLFSDDVNELDAAKFADDSICVWAKSTFDCIYAGIRRLFNEGWMVSSKRKE